MLFMSFFFLDKKLKINYACCNPNWPELQILKMVLTAELGGINYDNNILKAPDPHYDQYKDRIPGSCLAQFGLLRLLYYKGYCYNFCKSWELEYDKYKYYFLVAMIRLLLFLLYFYFLWWTQAVQVIMNKLNLINF